MRKILLLMMTGVSLCITTAKAQFNTVAVTPTRYKMEVLGMGLAQAEPAPESEIS
ncbi:M23 family peptidase, partial [Bacteroides fragilis]|nr:M23 family peptidase [Bacteroides fragilis]